MKRTQKTLALISLLFALNPHKSFAQDCAVDELQVVDIPADEDFEDLYSNAKFLTFSKRIGVFSSCAIDLKPIGDHAAAVFNWPGFLGFGGASADFTIYNYEDPYCIEVGAVYQIQRPGNISPHHEMELHRVDQPDGIVIKLTAERDLEIGKIFKKTGIQGLSCPE